MKDKKSPTAVKKWSAIVVSGSEWQLGAVALDGNRDILVFLPRDNIPFL